jgi:choline kinase
MKVLILAAGKGSRISRYLNGNPKCTVDIGNGTPLIEYTLANLQKRYLNDVAIITGYCHKTIEDLAEKYNVKTFYNPFYDVTNSIASAYFGREFLKENDDYIIMNADVFLEEALFDYILQTEHSPVLFADETRKAEADYKLYYENNILMKYGKELSGRDISGEYIGLALIKREDMPCFHSQLIKMIEEEQQYSVWWENVLYAQTTSKNIYVKDVRQLFWAEVDYIEDYERIRQFVKSGNLYPAG